MKRPYWLIAPQAMVLSVTGSLKRSCSYLANDSNSTLPDNGLKWYFILNMLYLKDHFKNRATVGTMITICEACITLCTVLLIMFM